jgi:hypothetical protein
VVISISLRVSVVLDVGLRVRVGEGERKCITLTLTLTHPLAVTPTLTHPHPYPHPQFLMGNKDFCRKPLFKKDLISQISKLKRHKIYSTFYALPDGIVCSFKKTEIIK